MPATPSSKTASWPALRCRISAPTTGESLVPESKSQPKRTENVLPLWIRCRHALARFLVAPTESRLGTYSRKAAPSRKPMVCCCRHESVRPLAALDQLQRLPAFSPSARPQRLVRAWKSMAAPDFDCFSSSCSSVSLLRVAADAALIPLRLFEWQELPQLALSVPAAFARV